MRPQRNSSLEEEESSGSWALSYGDMMTLLLAFFVLIVSFSTVELIKFRKAMGSLRGALGVLMEQEGDAVVNEGQSMFERPLLDKEILMKALSELEAQVFMLNAGEGMEIEVREEGVNFRLKEELVFDPGASELKPSVLRILDGIGKIIRQFSCEVRVEGHTDNLPIHTERFPSNWELSAVRAVSVVRYFTDKIKISPDRLVAVGCGEYRPLVPNDTPENRRKNRRVEIFLNWGNVSKSLIS